MDQKVIEGTETVTGVSVPITKQKTKINSKLLFIIIVGWFVMIADGYDLGIYGAVLPNLLQYQQWNLTAANAGMIASFALFGMFFGAVLVGIITDLIGRKWTLISCVTIFSVSMGLVAIAPSPEMFALFRFIGGIGLGGVLPAVSAITVEYSQPKNRSMTYTIVFTGYSFGIVLGALLSMFLLEDFGWRIMFWLGVIPLILVPILIKYLPESMSFLMTKGKIEEATKLSERYNLPLPTEEDPKEQNGTTKNIFSGVKTLFVPSYRVATTLLWITFIMGFFMIYGLNTWLPQMMREAGYPLGSSLSFLLMLNLTSMIGAVIQGYMADRWGSKWVMTTFYFLGALSLVFLSFKTSSIFIVYLLVGVAGLGSVAIGQVLNAFVTKYYPPHSRATSLGLALGCGRIGAISAPILIGSLMSLNYDYEWNFYIFGFAALIATIAVSLIPSNNKGKI